MSSTIIAEPMMIDIIVIIHLQLIRVICAASHNNTTHEKKLKKKTFFFFTTHLLALYEIMLSNRFSCFILKEYVVFSISSDDVPVLL